MGLIMMDLKFAEHVNASSCSLLPSPCFHPVFLFSFLSPSILFTFAFPFLHTVFRLLTETLNSDIEEEEENTHEQQDKKAPKDQRREASPAEARECMRDIDGRAEGSRASKHCLKVINHPH